MSENTNEREAIIKDLMRSDKIDIATRLEAAIREINYLHSIVHKQNKSIATTAEALEKALAIALNYTEHGHERRKITSEIRALIKE